MMGPSISFRGEIAVRDVVELGRLKSFSDGVFAIAATLLAFNVHLPAAPDQPFTGLLGQIGPQIFAFLISFVVAAIYWRNHNRLFAMLDKVDARLNQLNMALLAAVCLMPFATGLIAGFHPTLGGFTLYAVAMALIGVLAASQWAYAALHPGLHAPGITSRQLWQWFAVASVAPATFLLSIALAGISIEWAMRSWSGIVVLIPLARHLTHR